MSASERRREVLKDRTHAQLVGSDIATLPDPKDWVVIIVPPGRSLNQNDTFHGFCDEIAKARPIWNDMPMSADDWKQLLVLSHAMATDGSGVRLTKDLEGHGLVQLRESTARMSKARATSLIEYTIIWATSHGIKITIPGER
jgi:hypothetical protein